MEDKEEEMERVRELNRARQKRFYEKNKEAINAKRRKQNKKEDTKPLEPANIVLPKVINLEEVNKLLEQLRANDVIKSDGSLNVYKGSIKRLMKMLHCENLIPCLEKPNEVKDAIDNSTFSLNTKKGLYQSVVFVVDNLELPYSSSILQEYKKLFDIIKLKTQSQAKEKTKEKVGTFTSYFEKVKEHFGEGSFMGILIGLYNEFTGRDIYQLKITNKKEEVNDEKNNYLLLTKPRYTMVIHKYKTSKKYGTYVVKINEDLTKLIRAFILEYHLTLGDYLFGNKPLSKFILESNKEIGVNGGIDLIRHMKITEEFDKAKAEGRVLTEEERIDLANKLQHSPSAQLMYLRNQ